MQKIFCPLFVFLILFPLLFGPNCSRKESYKLKDIKFIQFYDPF